MKKFIYISLTLVFLFSFWMFYVKYKSENHEKEHQEWVVNLKSTASKNVNIVEGVFAINNSSDKRDLAIYLPENYESDTVSYPVFYFFDGQSIFDEKILEGDEWEVDEVLDSLGRLNQKAIAIGIYNTEYRDSEYQPNFNSNEYDKRFTGNLHCEWIVNELKPWIDKNYRTKSDPLNTIIGGSSFGGLMSYFILTEYPDIFGGALILSPSFWVNDKSTERDHKIENIEQKYIYLSAGEKERGIINGAKWLNKKLLKRKLQENYRFEIEEGEVHRNLAWRKMIRKSIPWVLNRINENSSS